MNIKLEELKEELKTIAKNIRKLKEEIKAGQKARTYMSIGIAYAFFREPDIGNQLTAIATYCDGSLFHGLRLI